MTIVGGLAAAGVMAVVLAGHGPQFSAALHTAPVWILGLAAALQLVALAVRTEAWHVCVQATGATVGRRPLYRASSVGYVAVLINGQLGVAARIAALRRADPRNSPRVPALIGAEVPIVATEATLAAISSFTLVGPLGLPWWVPVLAFAVMALVTVGLCRLSRRRRRGLWSGLAALRTLGERSHVIALVMVAVLAQIARNWLVLRATGIPVSLLDSIALLIAITVISQLPLGPSVGAGAAVLILGSHGVAAVAAAGVLLTVTGTIGALCFAAWAIGDWLYEHQPRLVPERTRARTRSALSTASAIRAALGALPVQRRRRLELAYFGGLNQLETARMLYLPLGSGRSRALAWAVPAWSS